LKLSYSLKIKKLTNPENLITFSRCVLQTLYFSVFSIFNGTRGRLLREGINDLFVLISSIA